MAKLLIRTNTVLQIVGEATNKGHIKAVGLGLLQLANLIMKFDYEVFIRNDS